MEKHHYIITAVAPWAPEKRVFHVVAQNQDVALEVAFKAFPELMDVRENGGEEYEVLFQFHRLPPIGSAAYGTIEEL